MAESMYALPSEIAAVLGLEEESVLRIISMNNRCPGLIKELNGSYSVSDYLKCAYLAVPDCALEEMETMITLYRAVGAPR